MALVLNDEQEQLRTTVRKLLADQAPMSRVRESLGLGHHTETYQQLARLGLTGLAIPERYEGAGAGQTEVALVLEELGRALTPLPYLASTALAAGALLCLDDEAARAELLPGIATGQATATLVLDAGTGTGAATGLSAVPAGAGDASLLTGTTGPVLDAVTADSVIVLAESAAGPEFHLVGGDTPGLTRTPLVSADPTRLFGRLRFDRVPARRLACADPVSARARIGDRAALAIAAEQLGGLRRCLEMTLAYAGTRVQFGRVIGSFQAVKHRCADLYTAAELAAALVGEAMRTADEDPAAFRTAAPAAKAYCGRAYADTARETIQLHGGIAYTWEHDAHFYYKRAHSTRTLFGDPRYHEALLADRLGLTG